MVEWSFRPRTNHFRSPYEQQNKPGIRNEELFKMSKLIQKYKKSDKKTDDVVYEKSKHEYTFTPRTNYPKKKNIDKPVLNAPSSKPLLGMKPKQESLPKEYESQPKTQRYKKNEDFDEFMKYEIKELDESQEASQSEVSPSKAQERNLLKTL